MKKPRKPKKTVTVTDLSPEVLERNRVKFGAWLRTRREELALSQREAAKAGKCSDAWICQLENAMCDCTAIQVNSLPKLALAYRVPVLTVLDALLGVCGCQRA
jgi:transcriptional regulator with XRE-family HTH domain